ncbi:MAG: pseudaminic acid synthase [Candidatus Melainabacteria bacterium]|nr:pseudaminic acid synthase [Candidatus Melainabacteria bacterium]
MIKTLNELKIGSQFPPFIVAELSGNHEQSLSKAMELLEAAKNAGVSALKLQTYTADTLTIKSDKPDFRISDSFDQWKGQTLYDLYNLAYTPWEWHEPIFKRCKELDLPVFSTPFDSTAVDFLESFDMPMYKIASFESNDMQLLKKVAQTKKPVIISTGLSNVSELYDSVKTLKDGGCSELVLLKCTSAYPANPAGSNLLTLPHMKELFGCEVGISDHTLGIGASVASIALGGIMIEKHIKLSAKQNSVDSLFSLTPSEMKLLVESSNSAWQSLGKVFYGISDDEKESVKFRRSLYVTKDIKRGEYFSEANVRSIRPGYGLPPKYLEQILGKTSSCDIEAGTAVRWSHLS